MNPTTSPSPFVVDADPERLLTPTEVAQLMQVPVSWVYSHQAALPVIRVGRYIRFRRAALLNFLATKVVCIA